MAMYKIGAMVTDDLTGKKTILLNRQKAAIAGSTAYPFKKAGADYTVTAGKTFYPCGMYISADAGIFAAACLPVIRYADDAALTTNPVDMGIGLMGYGTIEVTVPICFPLVGCTPVPAGKYIGVFNTSATASAQFIGVTLVGYEA